MRALDEPVNQAVAWRAAGIVKALTRRVLLVTQVKEDLLELLAATCLMIATRGERDAQLPSDADFERVTGLQVRLWDRAPSFLGRKL